MTRWPEVVRLMRSEAERERLAKLREKAPYGEMCRNPDLCAGKGSCPLNPTCGD